MKSIQHRIVTAIQQRCNLCTGAAESTSYARMYDLTGYRDCLSWDTLGYAFRYKLWGNQIAKGSTYSHILTISDCGYATPTTASRLNAIFAGLGIPMSVSVIKGSTVYFIEGQRLKNPDSHDEFIINKCGWQVTIA